MAKHLLVVNLMTSSVLDSVRELRQQEEWRDLSVVLVTQTPEKYADLEPGEVPFVMLAVNFSNAAQLATVLSPYLDSIAGIICRGDKHIQYLRQVLPLLPPGLPVPTVEALQASTDKRLMREAFAAKFPDITPKHMQVQDGGEETLNRVESVMSYPVIVKPTSLVSSMLIQSCRNRDALQAALDKIFASIGEIYKREERSGTPEVIVEEFMEGDFYSIDAYMLADGDIYCCPPVAYLPAKSMGIDDFFLYKRWVPTALTADEMAGAEATCRQAMQAVGLCYSVAHIELILTAHGWKVIELGPRLGRFRQTMYRTGYGIDHSTNDILVRLGQPPIIPKKLIARCAAYSIYPPQEGRLEEITHASELELLPEVDYFKLLGQPGQEVKFAKHGGTALLEVIVSTADPEAYHSVTSFIEANVKAITNSS